MAPRVGITSWPRVVGVVGISQPNQTFPTNYVDSVLAAGGHPILIPQVEAKLVPLVLDGLDGVVVTGGGDVDPARYGSEPRPETADLDTERDDFEPALLAEALGSGLPVLGICRAAQILNVAHGGTLHQHVGAHRVVDKFDQTAHTVLVAAESELGRVLGATELGVNSLHHQAVDRVGAGLRVTATAPDGGIEALEVDGRDDVLTVQWHPEMLSHERPEQLALFEWLVARATDRSRAATAAR